MAAHSALWIERALRTEPADPSAIGEAIKGLYRAANLTDPRVIVVPSPFVMAMAGGIASVWWYLFENKLLGKKRKAVTVAATEAVTEAVTKAATWGATKAATKAATYAVTKDAADHATCDETEDATYAATEAATRDATYTATKAATDDATRAATAAATEDATYTATIEATDGATWDATYGATKVATDDATDAAAKDATGKDWRALAAHFVGEEWAQAALDAAKNWVSVSQEGNMEVSWDCYYTAARDILGLRLKPHAAYAYWEQAAIHGGFRWMHPKFCLVSDFPEVLRIDAQNRPHAEFGPSRRWRDGFSIWHLNGVRVEQWMAENHPDEIAARIEDRIKPRLEYKKSQEMNLCRPSRRERAI
ncbi:MAG TPA: hypothetical protein VFY40_24345 [Blastocatellia bacterium]|nr:hypothetical protein [Blastocatellia bacterium]